MSSPLECWLEELVSDFGISSAFIPSSLRLQHPELEATGERLSLQLSLTPAGDEDLIVVSAETDDPGVLENVVSALKSFEKAPYLVLISPAEAPARAARAAETMIATSPGWLVRDDPPASGLALLAAVDRLLSMSKAPGEWRAAPAGGEPPRTEEEALAKLWAAIERDRDHLETVALQLLQTTWELDDARTGRERLRTELARLRDGEHYELDRMRMAMLDQRAWVAEQARRIAESTSWRTGHRLVRVARALTFRRDRGTDLPAMVATRMEREELP